MGPVRCPRVRSPRRAACTRISCGCGQTPCRSPAEWRSWSPTAFEMLCLHGLPEGDVPRAVPGRAGTLSAAYPAADRPDRRGGTRISRQGRGAGAAALAVMFSRHTALRVLLNLPLPGVRRRGSSGSTTTPSPRRALRDGADRRRDTGGASTSPGRTADTPKSGCAIIPGPRSCAVTARGPMPRPSAGRCRGAVRRPLAHLARRGEAVRKEVAATRPAGRRAPAPRGQARCHQPGALAPDPRPAGQRLVGLLECARRLNLALNTVKRYARVPGSPNVSCAPRPTGPLSSTHTANTCANGGPRTPAVPVLQLLARDQNAWVTTGAARTCSPATSPRARSRSERPTSLSSRRVTRLLVTKPENLTPGE